MTVARHAFNYYPTGDVWTLENELGSEENAFEFLYDDRHQLISATDSESGYQAAFQYTAAGRLHKATIDPPPSAPLAHARDVEYDYSGASDSEAVDLLKNNTGGGNFAELSYDEAGNLVTESA